jgi:hypothetical protein
LGLNNSHKCPYCISKTNEKYEECKQIAKEKGSKLLSKEYINTTSKLIWKCSEGHIFEASYTRIKTAWCAKCKTKKATYKKRTIEDFKKFAKEKGGKCLSDVTVGANSNIKWRCKNGHEWFDKFGIAKKRWCQECHSSDE